jgi:diguanylate cyclase (GGDEF)-like protein
MPQPQLLKASTLLSRLQLFRNVDMNSISDCISRCEFREVEADKVLLSPEFENNEVYMVISGRLMVYLEYPDQQALTIVEPGECVGEMSIIEGKNPSAYVVASEPTHIMAIPQDVLWDMLDTSHQVTRNMLHLMSMRLRFSNVVIAESMNTQQEFMRHATIDALTGLHNRRWMDSMFEQEMVHSQRESFPLCLLMIDVDHFKLYNDNYGHIAGDKVLSNVADALRGALRPIDMLARFGGEEFAILLPETTPEEAQKLAEKLRHTVSQTKTKNDKGEALPEVTVSIGISELKQQKDLLSLIAEADEALYRAKNNGRNCVSD